MEKCNTRVCGLFLDGVSGRAREYLQNLHGEVAGADVLMDQNQNQNQNQKRRTGVSAPQG
jgi:hypothetical protein